MGYKINSAQKKLITPNYELQNSNNAIETIHESSEIAETIKELNDDTLQNDKFTPIDMKTRLAQIEISSIIAVDSLVALDFLPEEAGFITRSKKRLAVSLKGMGREEVVKIAQGMTEQTKGKSFFDRIGGMFRGGN